MKVHFFFFETFGANDGSVKTGSKDEEQHLGVLLLIFTPWSSVFSISFTVRPGRGGHTMYVFLALTFPNRIHIPS